jgi:hypothetical protein
VYLLSVFVLPVYSRLCSLLGIAFSVHCIHERRDFLKDLAFLILQKNVVRKFRVCPYVDPGRYHICILSWLFRLQISMRTYLFRGFTHVSPLTHSPDSTSKYSTMSSLFLGVSVITVTFSGVLYDTLSVSLNKMTKGMEHA